MPRSNTDFLAPAQSPAASDLGESGNPLAALVETYWHGVRKNKWLVLAIIATAIIAALVITLLATPQYSAGARIEINREQANVTNVEGLEPEEGNQDIEFYQTQYALLEARSVAARVATAMRVITSDELFELFDMDVDAIIGSRANTAGKRVPAAQQRLDLATDLLMANVQISPVRGSRLVDVSFTSPSPKLSADTANLWVQQFQEATLERRFASTADAREFLETRLSELRGRLEDSERQLVSYAADKEIVPLADRRDAEGNTNTSETLRSANLRASNEALAQATRERMAAESRMRQGGAASAQSLDNQALNGIRQQRATIAAELAQQLTIFEPEYPAVRALQSQLTALDQSIAREEARIRTAAGTDYRAALSNERQLASEVASLKQDTLGERRDSIQFAIYQREVDTNRELYEGLLQRYKEIGVAGVGANNITVVDIAEVPDEPSSPNLPLNLAIGILAGLGLASGFVFVREQLDQSLSDPAQVTELLGLPLLGAVPEETEQEPQEALSDVKSQMSEAYFSTASNLSFLTSSGVPRSMAITSTRPNEGKSLTAYALSVALARTGKSVLLIDADLRNPTQHHLFELDNSRGLSNLLAGEGMENPTDYCLPTDKKSVFFMPGGPMPPEPGALLSGDQLGKLVEDLGNHYDHVIVDGPPILGLADAPLISKAVEGVIYTVEANGLKIRAIQSGLRRLGFANATIFGAIVTKLNRQNAAYGYGADYGYGYGYGSDDN